MKIAIIDTGIDQTHPAFQDSSLTMPAGYPMCNVSNCAAYTNNKVIVARSYVQQLAAGSDPNNPPPTRVPTIILRAIVPAMAPQRPPAPRQCPTPGRRV